MRLGLSMTIPGLDARQCIDAAVDAASAGAGLLSFGESRYDPVVLAAGVAVQASVELAAGIARWDRDAASLARAATCVAELSRLPYRLGVGPGPVRGPLSGGLTRMRTYLGDLRTEIPDDGSVLLWLAAASPKMAELAGQAADGVLLSRIHSPRQLCDVLVPALAAGQVQRRAGLNRIERGILVRCAVTDTEAEGVRVIQQAVIDYELPLIGRILSADGHDLSKAIGFRQQDLLEDAAAAVPETLVRGMALVGPPEACVEQLERYADFDIVSLYPCGETPDAAMYGAQRLLRLWSRR